MFKRYFEKKFKKAISNVLAVSIVLGNINIGAVGDSLKETQENKIVSSTESKLNSLKKFIVNNPKKVAGAGLLSLTGIGGLGFILSKLFEKNNSNKKEEETKDCIENIDGLFVENFKPDDNKTWEQVAYEVFGSVNGLTNGGGEYSNLGINQDEVFKKVINNQYNQKDLCKKLETYYLYSSNENDRIFNPQKRALLFAIYRETNNKNLKNKCLEINDELNKKALILFLKTYTPGAKLLAKIFLLFQLGEIKFTKSSSANDFEEENIEIFKAIAQGESVVVTLPEKFAKEEKDLFDNDIFWYNDQSSILKLSVDNRFSTHGFMEKKRDDDGTIYFCESKQNPVTSGAKGAVGKVVRLITDRFDECFLKNRSVAVDVCNYNGSKEKNELLVTTCKNMALFKLEPVASGCTSSYGHQHGVGGGSNNITPTGQFRAWNQFKQRKAMIADLSGCKMEEFKKICHRFSDKLNKENFDFEKLINKQLNVDELSELIGYEDKEELKNCRDHLAPYKSFSNFKELNCCNKLKDSSYNICIKYNNNRCRKINVNAEGEILSYEDLKKIGYTDGCVSLDKESRNAIYIGDLNKKSGDFVEKFKQEVSNIEQTQNKIPGVKIYRTVFSNITYYGYIIEDAKKFLNWCENNNMPEEDKKIILLCQNLWFYTSNVVNWGSTGSWKISDLPEGFKNKIEKIKEANTSTKNKDSEYVTNVDSRSGEWRIYRNDSDEFRRIKEQLDIVKEEMSLNVELWVECFNNEVPFKGIEEIKGKFNLS